MRKLFVMRHGETTFNVMGRIQGRCDSPLTKNGIQQAEQARDYFKSRGIVFDHLYTSLVARSMDTGILITEAPMTRLVDLSEWSFGKMEAESRSLVVWYDQHPEASSYEDWFVQFGGENNKQVEERMVRALDRIVQDGHEMNLAVTHGAALWAMLLARHETYVTGGLFIGNCAILEYDILDDQTLSFVQMVNPHAKGWEDFKYAKQVDKTPADKNQAKEG